MTSLLVIPKAGVGHRSSAYDKAECGVTDM